MAPPPEPVEEMVEEDEVNEDEDDSVEELKEDPVAL
jgi:hypothetical protein